MRFHHAPWSRRFRTFYVRGQFAHELQVGPLVIQWFFKRVVLPLPNASAPRHRIGPHLIVWRDRHWR